MIREINILPKKHVPLSMSLFGFGAQLVELLIEEMTSDELWEKYINQKHNVIHSYDEYILSLDFLFMVGAIDMKDDGRLCLNY